MPDSHSQPALGSACERALAHNARASKRARIAIYFLLVMRFHHGPDCGLFGGLPKDLVRLIAKYVWRTRRDPAWSENWQEPTIK
jgi:hypothetical protein